MTSMLEQPLDLVATNAVLDSYDPSRIVNWAAEEFGDDLVMSSSFGAESACLLHMAIQPKPGVT